MPLPTFDNLTELLGSRPRKIINSGSESRRIFYAEGYDDPDAIDAFLNPIGTPHPTIFNCYLVGNDVEQMTNAQALLKITEIYQPPASVSQNVNPHGEVWLWDMNARSVRITSVETRDKQTRYDKDYPNGSPPIGNFGANLETAVGVDGDNVKGANVYRPFSALRVTKYLATSIVNKAYRQDLDSRQNTINESSWQDWAAREVLFIGSRITIDTTASVTAIEYNFLTGKRRLDVKADVFNEANPSLPTVEVTIGDVDPHQITWYKYEKRFIPESLSPFNKNGEDKNFIIEAFKTDVYEESDFDDLDLVGPE